MGKKTFYIEFGELWPNCSLSDDIEDAFLPVEKHKIELTEEEYKDYQNISDRYHEWNNRLLVSCGYYDK